MGVEKVERVAVVAMCFRSILSAALTATDEPYS